MDWLRSEDLKEEKNVTAPMIIIAVGALLHPVVADNKAEEGYSESACPYLCQWMNSVQ